MLETNRVQFFDSQCIYAAFVITHIVNINTASSVVAIG